MVPCEGSSTRDAGLLVDLDELDPLRNREGQDGEHVECLLHEIRPNGKGGMGAGLHFAECLHAVESYPDAGGEIRSIADEPRVAVTVGGAGFAGQGTPDRAGAFACSALNDVHHHVCNQIGGFFGDHLPGFEHVLLQDMVMLIFDQGNGVGFQRQSLVGKHTIRRSELLKRYARRTKRQCQVRA